MPETSLSATFGRDNNAGEKFTKAQVNYNAINPTGEESSSRWMRSHHFGHSGVLSVPGHLFPGHISVITERRH